MALDDTELSSSFAAVDLQVEGNGAIAELMAGIDELDTDGGAVDIGNVAPFAFARMPGAFSFINQAEYAAVFLDHIMRADFCRRIAKARQALRRPRRHAGIMHDDELQRLWQDRTSIEIGEGRKMGFGVWGSGGVGDGTAPPLSIPDPCSLTPDPSLYPPRLAYIVISGVDAFHFLGRGSDKFGRHALRDQFIGMVLAD